jgi:hypothetical protein
MKLGHPEYEGRVVTQSTVTFGDVRFIFSSLGLGPSQFIMPDVFCTSVTLAANCFSL